MGQPRRIIGAPGVGTAQTSGLPVAGRQEIPGTTGEQSLIAAVGSVTLGASRISWILVALLICGCDQDRAAGPKKPDVPGVRRSVELAQNGGFERGDASIPEGWSQDVAATGGLGTVLRDTATAHSGTASLKLQPNQNNNDQRPLALSQLIPAREYLGSQIEFSGYLRAEGKAIATLGMLSVVNGQPKKLVLLAQPGGGSGWSFKSGVYNVPDDPSTQLAFICMVNGQSGAVWFDDVSVKTAGATEVPDGGEPTELTATIDVDASKVIRQIPRTLFGTNVEWRWNANFLWQESRDRLDPQLVRLTRELGVTVIRFPGGVYSDHYHWKDGVGPRAKRREVVHEPGSDDRSRPNFGTDEALAFAKSVGAELMITVNAGSGTPTEAAEWVRYVNKNELRVRYWEVGNELYINDGTVFASQISVDPGTYAARFLEFAKAMRAADSRIKIGGIGGVNQGRYAVVSYPNWNETVLRKAGDQMDFLSVHNAYAPVVLDDSKKLGEVYRAMLAAPVLIRQNLETVAAQIAKYASRRATPMTIAVTEWGPFFQITFKSRYVDHNKTLGAALFTASTFKVLLESQQTTIANFWLLNDVSVLGWIGSRNNDFPARPDWIPTARYYALQMFSRHFGDRLIASKSSGPTFDSRAVGFVDAVEDVPYLDVVSSLSSDGSRAYVLAINKHIDKPIAATITLRGFSPQSIGTAWTLAGRSIDAHTGTKVIDVPGLGLARQARAETNARFDKGGPTEISLAARQVRVSAQFEYSFPARSVTSLVLTRATH